MRRFIFLFLIIVLVIGGAAFLFPMRLAISLAGLDDAGLAAQDVQGTIWSGRLVDAQFRGINLGTLDAAIVPSSLLSKPALTMIRKNAEGEDFTAMISGSAAQLQVSDAMGDIPLAALAGRIPVSTAKISNGNIALDNGRCMSASGDLEMRPSGLLARFIGDQAMRGSLACQGDNIAMQLASSTETIMLSASLDPQRRYQMQLILNNLSPEIAFGLRSLGFGQDGDSLTISHDGILR